MAVVQVQVDTTEVSEALENLIRLGRRPEPALKDIGEYMQVAVDDRFAAQTAPDGTPWAPNSPKTLARKRNPRILHDSTRLRGSINYQVQGAELRQGTNLIYAATQHFGAAQGAFGRTSRGGPIPWGDIPARPILGFSGDDQAEMLRLLMEHTTRAWSGRSA